MFIIVMGVSGSGKTTVGKRVAERLARPFYDGDDFHTAVNIAKMAAGIPLTDDDRAGWLATIAAHIREGLAQGESGVIACSALKEQYREALRVDPQRVKFIYLKGSYSVILERLQRRVGHYMQPALLRSQFEALEEPADALTIDITLEPDEITDKIMAQIRDPVEKKAIPQN